jgi:hypothetical protein
MDANPKGDDCPNDSMEREALMALKGVLRPGYIQIRVTDLDAALKHYVDRIGLPPEFGQDGRQPLN